MKRTIRVGIVQQACTNDLKLNLEKLHRNIASVVLLLWTFLFHCMIVLRFILS